MNAVERLTAAIEKLEEMRERATDGPWLAWHPASHPFARGNSSVDALTHDPDNPDMVVEGGAQDVELIVTLHRTIEPILMTLRQGIPYAAKDCLFEDAYELALADAILGSAS